MCLRLAEVGKTFIDVTMSESFAREACLNLVVSHGPTGHPGVVISTVFNGPADKGAEVIKPFTDLGPIMQMVRSHPPIASLLCSVHGLQCVFSSSSSGLYGILGGAGALRSSAAVDRSNGATWPQLLSEWHLPQGRPPPPQGSLHASSITTNIKSRLSY